jgi:serine/threonine protein kinase
MQAVQEFCALLESGQRPNRQEFLRRYPDLAEPLAQCLAGLELVHKTSSAEKKSSAGQEKLGVGPDNMLPANPLGDFQIMREIGRGGMGIVYEAVQLSLGRRVALKVLPFAATFDNKHLQRFHNEAQAAAQLHHTNIVPIYYVGSDRGVHFYAMQLIDGHSLAVVIRQIRRQVKQPIESGDSIPRAVPPPEVVKDGSTLPFAGVLPLPPSDAPDRETVSQVALALSTQRSGKHVKFFSAAARFVMQAAEALDHAHQYGIIHRDIKPANLLVDTHGRLWISDFGLAQIRADAGLTRTGDLLGTLRYMSPEQASGQRVLLDHRTDIYSLGATLYELVTLTPMFPEQDQHALLYQIINDEPRAPRTIDKSVPVDLETIILKAVSKNPADRYATAQEFAADLQRYLEDKPIQAKRPSLPERARKWSRRHPSFVGAIVVVLALLTVGSLVSAAIVQGEKAKADLRAKDAEERFQLARRSVDEMIEISEGELSDNPFAQRARRQLLEAALRYYQEFIEQRKDDPAATADLVATQDRVKRILSDLALLNGAGQLDLLSQAAVLDDLRATEEQRKRIAELFGQINKQREGTFREWGRLSPTEFQKHFLDSARANDAEVRQILTDTQRKRFGQIALQAQGLAAFREPEIASALKLTTEQRERIRAIEADTFRGGPPEGWPPDGPPRGGHREGSPGGKRPEGPPPEKRNAWFEEMRKAQEQRRKEACNRGLALLTAEQLKTWNELIGEPFTGSLHCGPPFGFPPPHP